MILQVQQMTAGYGTLPVVHELDFTVARGEICGLIGLNGAGKSTTIKAITGLLQPFSGSIHINGQTLQADAKAYRQSLAFIPETPVLYEELTFREHIELTARAYQQYNEQTIKRAMDLVEQFRLTKQLDWFPAYFSKGMKQKVLIVCALMLDVALYVVDEPFLGLDPLGIRTLLNCLQAKKAQGSAILMSTHVLDTAEKYCDRFIVLHEGQLQAQGSLVDLQAGHQGLDQSLEAIYFSLTSEGGSHA